MAEMRSISKILSRYWIRKIDVVFEELEDKIICRIKRNDFEYNRALTVSDLAYIEKEHLERLKSNKPIYYIFDGYNFEYRFVMYMPDDYCANIIFKNCIFNEEVYLYNCCSVEFENNTYKNMFPEYYYTENCFFFIDGIKKLIFRNDNFVNSDEKKCRKGVKFRMSIQNAKEIEFINTRVETSYLNTINADTIRLVNSTLIGTEFEITAKSIESENSVINAATGVIINNPGCTFNGKINAPLVFYNGEPICIIDTLKQIKDEASRRDTRGVGDIMGIKPYTRKKVPKK